MIYRGNVIEVRKDSLVVMLDNLTFERVKKFKGLEEGMEIYFEERDIIRKSNMNFKNIVLIAASILLFIVTSFYGVDVWNTNYRAIALISVDINPSIEININKNHNVINAIALNEDAKKLPLKTLKNQPLADALEELINMARAEGYIKETEENYILVTSVELRENEQEQRALVDLIAEGKKKIENSAIEAGEQVEVIAMQASKETLKEAQKENISVGKKEHYRNTLDKENLKIKEKDNLKEKLDKDKEQLDKHLKQLEKEAEQLDQKLRENQKNNNKYNKIIKEEIKEEKNAIKDVMNQEKNEIKDIISQEKDRIKDIIKQEKDELKDTIKQEKDEIKDAIKQEKNDNKEQEKQDKDSQKELKKEENSDEKEEDKQKEEEKEDKQKKEEEKEDKDKDKDKEKDKDKDKEKDKEEKEKEKDKTEKSNNPQDSKKK